MIVSGDVGGTKTLLGVFESAAPRPRLVATHEIDGRSTVFCYECQR